MHQQTSQISSWLTTGMPDEIGPVLEDARRCAAIDAQHHAEELLTLQQQIAAEIAELQLSVASGPQDAPRFLQQQSEIATRHFEELQTRYLRLRPATESSQTAAIDECLNNHRACIAHLMTLQDLTTLWSRKNDHVDNDDSSFDDTTITDLLAQLEDAETETGELPSAST